MYTRVLALNSISQYFTNLVRISRNYCISDTHFFKDFKVEIPIFLPTLTAHL